MKLFRVLSSFYQTLLRVSLIKILFIGLLGMNLLVFLSFFFDVNFREKGLADSKDIVTDVFIEATGLQGTFTSRVCGHCKRKMKMTHIPPEEGFDPV